MLGPQTLLYTCNSNQMVHEVLMHCQDTCMTRHCNMTTISATAAVMHHQSGTDVNSLSQMLSTVALARYLLQSSSHQRLSC